MGAATVVPDIASLEALVGKELGASQWIEVSQARIDAFAEATGDRQWIHVDPERAAREGPFGGTVAHGHLPLSLAAVLLRDLLEVQQVGFVVNPGFERMRLRAPVRAGTRLRMRASLERFRALPGGAARITLRRHFEAARAEVLAGHPGRDAEAATRLLLNRLLHAPSQALRELAGSEADGSQALERLATRLFALDKAGCDDLEEEE